MYFYAINNINIVFRGFRCHKDTTYIKIVNYQFYVIIYIIPLIKAYNYENQYF